MSVADDDDGSWFAAARPPATDPETQLAYARCFGGADGQRVLAHLRRLTLERALGPAASDCQLRHLEGQRQLVSTIESLVRRGQAGT